MKLLEHLDMLLAEINDQILTIEHDVTRNKYVTNIYQLKKPDGSYLMADLLCAKANVLIAIANLRTL